MDNKDFERKQLAMRQVAANKQVLQALQQAMAALMEAQQQVLADIKFHEDLSVSGDLSGWQHGDLNSKHTGESDNRLQPWQMGGPPSLQ